MGTKLKSRDRFGGTPLDDAIREGHKEMCVLTKRNSAKQLSTAGWPAPWAEGFTNVPLGGPGIVPYDFKYFGRCLPWGEGRLSTRPLFNTTTQSAHTVVYQEGFHLGLQHRLRARPLCCARPPCPHRF